MHSVLTHKQSGIRKYIMCKDNQLISTNISSFLITPNKNNLHEGFYLQVGNYFFEESNQDDFPEVPTVSGYEFLLSENILDFLRNTKFCSTDGARLSLQGAYLEFEPNKLLITMTTGYMLIHREFTINNDKNLSKNLSIVIAREDLDNLHKFLRKTKNKEVKLLVDTEAERACFVTQDFQYNIRLISKEPYPDWRCVVPVNDIKISINRESILNCLKDLKPISKIAILNFKNNTIEAAGEELQLALPLEYQIDGNITIERIAFCIDYLIKCLSVNKKETQTILEIKNETDKAVIIDKRNDFFILLMPTRLGD